MLDCYNTPSKPNILSKEKCILGESRIKPTNIFRFIFGFPLGEQNKVISEFAAFNQHAQLHNDENLIKVKPTKNIAIYLKCCQPFLHLG